MMGMGAMLEGVREGCNSIEIHIVGHVKGHGTGLAGPAGPAVLSGTRGWARVDLPRDEMIGMMRTALGSRSLSTCRTWQCRLQSAHIRDLTMERVLRTTTPPTSSTLVERSTLLGVSDMRQHLPLVWMEWTKQRLPPPAFPCVMQRHDLRHCIRREIVCGEGVSLFFETHMDSRTQRSVYRIWIHVSDLRDTAAVAVSLNRALDGLGIQQWTPV